MAATAPVNLTKPWVERWPDPRVRAALALELQAVPMDAAAARAWMSSVFAVGATSVDLIEIAEEWGSVGLPAREALTWAEGGTCFPEEALDWYLRGFTPDEVELITNVIAFNSRGKTFEGAEAEATAWRTSDLPPRLVVLGVANDESPEWMLQQVAAGAMTASVQGTLAFFAGLRGVDVHGLTIDWEALARARRVAMLDPGWQ